MDLVIRASRLWVSFCCGLLFTALTARAQFSSGSLVATPANSQAQPVVLNQGQNYPSALSFTINFSQLGVSISRIEIRPGLPPGLDGGGSIQGDAYVVLNRPTVVLFGTPTTPGDYKLSVTATTSTGLVSTSQVSPWDVYVRVAASGTAPTITTHPTGQTVTAGANVTFTAAADGSPAPTYQWRKDGVALPGATSATLTLTAVTAANAGAYTVVATNAAGAATSNAATLVVNAAASAPSVTSQPQAVTVSAGSPATFTVTATGTPSPTFQWRRDGVPLTGATAPTLTLASVSSSDAGRYSVVVSNSAGSVTSNEALLTVIVPTAAPVITGPPQNVAVAAGSTVAFAVIATGSPAPSFQWRKDGTAIAGATDATLVLPAVTTASAGAYSVVVTNSAGSVTSTPGNLTISAGAGRLANLSIRTNLATSQTLIVGFATNGSKSVLLRAIGPELRNYQVTGAYDDPRMELYTAASAKIEENDNWLGALTNTFAAVGAFPLTPNSKDAALQSTLSGTYSAHIKGPNSGVVLVELYDAGAGTAVRLVNASARNLVGTGDNVMIAGFVLDGTVARTLLIRAIGPKLGDYGVSGFLVDPKLEIYNSAGIKIVENDNWSPALATTFDRVSAFQPTANSRDAALLVTLMPGSYSAQVSGVAGGTGEALVEVYELP